MIKNKVVKNASWIIGCKIIQSVLSLVVGSLTARYLGPSDYGLINYAASVVAFVTPIMQLGLNMILVNEFVNSPDDEGKILGTTLTLNLLSGLLSCGGVFLFVSIAKSGDTFAQIVCMLYSMVLITQVSEMISYWYQAKFASKYVSVVSIASYLIVSAYKIYLLITQKSIAWFAVSQALDYLIISLVLMFFYHRLGGGRLGFSLSTARRLLSRGKYYILSSMMVTSFVQIDKVFLEMFLDEAQVGIYSAASVCAGVTAFVFTAIIDSARPSIFEAKKAGREQYETQIKRLFSIVIYLGLAQGIAMTLLSDVIVFILYGAEYASASSSLRVLAWITMFSTIGSVRNIWLLAEEKQKYLWIVNICGAVFNIGVNLILIPLVGTVGAAITSLLTQIFTNIITGYIIRPISQYNKLMLGSLNPAWMWRLFKQEVSAIRNRIKK